MDKMTNGERVAYAHGRVKGDIDDIRDTVDELHRGMNTAYRAWLTVLICGLVILILAAIPLVALPHLRWYCIAYAAISILTFSIGRLISFHRISAVMRIVQLIDVVIHSLSNSQTLHVGFESIQQANKEQKARDDDAARTG